MNRPTPDPSQEGNRHPSASCPFPSWEGLGVGSWSQCMRESEWRLSMNLGIVGPRLWSQTYPQRVRIYESAAASILASDISKIPSQRMGWSHSDPNPTSLRDIVTTKIGDVSDARFRHQRGPNALADRMDWLQFQVSAKKKKKKKRKK